MRSMYSLVSSNAISSLGGSVRLTLLLRYLHQQIGEGHKISHTELFGSLVEQWMLGYLERLQCIAQGFSPLIEARFDYLKKPSLVAGECPNGVATQAYDS